MNPVAFKPDEHDAKDLETSYGWFKWRPTWLQKYGSRPVTFLTIICCCAFVQEFTVSGIVNLCVSSVERQFRLSSTQTGAVISAYDIAFLAASGPISWAGGRSVHEASKIRYLSVGLLCLAGGSIIFASPQFFTPPYEFSSISETCTKTLASNYSNANLTSSPTQSNAAPLIALLTGNVLHGIGSAPLYTLGVAYIDENSEYASVPMYLGIYYAVSVLGPAFGFLFGAFSLTFYVDRWRQTTSNLQLETSDPNWVGAWWLSFLVCAGLALLVTLPLSGFPSHLPGMLERFKARSDTSFAGIKRKVRDLHGKSGENGNSQATRSIITVVRDCFKKIWSRTTGKSEEVADINRESDNLDLAPTTKKVGNKVIALPLGCLNMSFGGVLKELHSLFTNIPYVFLTLAGAADGFLLNSFAAFLPKYLEMQFAISAKDASLYVGVLTVPAGTLGMFLGGYLIKKFNVSVVGMFKIIFWSSLVNMLCMFALLTTCPESKFAGVNYRSPYLINSRTSTIHGIEGLTQNAGKIEFVCNLGCKCQYTYDPVCGSNNAMYYSACHAGCALKGVGSDSRNYNGCDCVPSNVSNTSDISTSKNKYKMGGSATLGSCPTNCARWKLLTFLGVMFFGLFLMLMIAVIAVNCTLKCVEGAENSLAMGVQWVFVRLLGTIPGPIIFGKIIDRNCLFWEMRSIQSAPSILGEIEYGSCKLYTNFGMAVDLFLLTLVCKIIAQLFYGVAYYSYWFYDKKPSMSGSHNIQTSELETDAPTLTL